MRVIDIPVEDRIYVLRYTIGYRSSPDVRYEYYTGNAPSRHINKAKIYSLQQARNTRTFAKTTGSCDIIRVTEKILFKKALQGI
jgi:hypothetical protein